MKTCVFFGHRDCPECMAEKLYIAVEKIIADEAIYDFLVGNNGNFDKMVINALLKLQEKYPGITFTIVLAYLPINNEQQNSDYTIYPEGIECVPKKYAISWRNMWLLNHADYVISYIVRNLGGAAKYVNIASKRNLPIINIAAIQGSSE